MNSNIDLTIFIPTLNEEIHIERVIKSAKRLTDNVFVVDSYSTDRTIELAKSLGAKVYQYKWDVDSNWAKKFNWALENLPITTNWIMRLDADEYLTEDFISELPNKLSNLTPGINAISINRRLYFMGKWMRHGGDYPISLVRIMRLHKAKYEYRWIDEHVEVENNSIEYINIDIVDDKKINLTKWINNHNSHSIKEAIELINSEIGLFGKAQTLNLEIDKKSLAKRKKKNFYSKFPLFYRAFAFFFYKYFIKLGFLDGAKGFLWYFLQCLWYRTICDAKVYEIYSQCGKDKKKIIEYIDEEYHLNLR